MMAKTFDQFLDALLSHESGINPELSKDYLNPNKHIDYLQVIKNPEPGSRSYVPWVVKRDEATGKPLQTKVSHLYDSYFETIGLAAVFDQINKATKEEDIKRILRDARYAVVNPWGFVGYQVGEAALASCGYYIPKKESGLEVYYRYVKDQSGFSHGATQTKIHVDQDASFAGRDIITTAWNKWEGTFTNKNGVNTFEDLKNPAKQELIIRDLMRYNLDVAIRQYKSDINKPALTDREALENMLKVKVARPKDHANAQDPAEIPVTISGILAAAHLGGAWGVAKLLANDGKETEDETHGDETGTKPYDYFLLFSGYETIFDTPQDDTITGSSTIRETLYAGWGNDRVIMNNPESTIVIHEQVKSVTTIEKFATGTNKIVLRGFSGVERKVDGSPSGIGLEPRVIRDSNTDRHDTVLHFADQSVVLQNVAIGSIDLGKCVIVQYVHSDLSWNGGSATQVHVVDKFDAKLDIIDGSKAQGIVFKDLRYQDTKDGVRLGEQGARGKPVALLLLRGIKHSDLRADNFDSISGQPSEMLPTDDWTNITRETTGKILADISWQAGPNSAVHHVDDFDLKNDVISGEKASGILYSGLRYENRSDGLVIGEQPASGKPIALIFLKGIKYSDLKEHNFTRIDGSFSDVKATIEWENSSKI